jgi:hypothetical protein
VLYLEVNSLVKDKVLNVRRSFIEGVSGLNTTGGSSDKPPSTGATKSSSTQQFDTFVPSLILGHFSCSEEAEVYRLSVESELASLGGLTFSPSHLALLHRDASHKPFKRLQVLELEGGRKRWFDIEGEEGEMEDMPPDVDKGTQKKRKRKTWGN